VVALAGKSGFLHAPDVYMDKIAVGPGLPEGVVALTYGVEENLHRLAKAKGCAVEELMVCMLERGRHEPLVKACRDAGARITLINSGDVAGVIAVAQKQSGIDLFIGSGGAPEGVLAAAALRCLGGQMQGRLLFEDETQVARARGMGITDPDRIYKVDEMARGPVLFAATGVTSGDWLRGVHRLGERSVTHSVVTRSASGTVRYIEASHVRR